MTRHEERVRFVPEECVGLVSSCLSGVVCGVGGLVVICLANLPLPRALRR
jgi:hypothetical protein